MKQLLTHLLCILILLLILLLLPNPTSASSHSQNPVDALDAAFSLAQSLKH